MLVLLPPSEGKAPAPKRGGPLKLAALSFPELGDLRNELVSALVELCNGDEDVARQTLGLPPGLISEIGKNQRLRDSPTLPVSRLYTGVLYDALDLDTLDAATKRRAQRSLVVFSALWGAVRLTDRLPPYRFSPDVRLPGIGTLVPKWRQPLDAAMTQAAGSGLLLDLRSSSYTALWRPADAIADRTVAMRVLLERTPGDPCSRVVVSHFNKAAKGRLVRGLLDSGADPKSRRALIGAVRDLGYVVDDSAEHTVGKPHQLDVIVSEL